MAPRAPIPGRTVTGRPLPPPDGTTPHRPAPAIDGPLVSGTRSMPTARRPRPGCRPRTRSGRWWPVAGALFGLLPVACTRPYAVESREVAPAPLPDGEPGRVETTRLSDDDRASIEEGFRAVVRPGYVPAARSAPHVPERGRWADVLPAARRAASSRDVRMVVVEAVQAPDGGSWTIELRTLDDRPAWLEVVRVDEPGVYEAAAVAGHFRERDSIAERLVLAFEEAMTELGDALRDGRRRAEEP